MQALDLVTSVRAILTKTENHADKTTSSYPCDLKGEPLPVGANPIYIFTDRLSGKTYARIAEVIPTSTLPADKAAAEAIVAQNPVHFADDNVKGWFVEAPDFNERESK